MSRQSDLTYRPFQIVLFSLLVGLIIGVLNIILNSGTVGSSFIAPVYAMAIGLGVMAINRWTKPARSTLGKSVGIIFLGYLIIGVATYFVIAKVLSLAKPGLNFQWNPKHLLLSVAVSGIIGYYNYRLRQSATPGDENTKDDDRDFLTVRLHNRIKLINFRDISHLEAKDKYVNIHSNGHVYLSSKTLSELIQQLPAQFIQIHRSAIVNRNFIHEVKKLQRGIYTFLLPDGVQLKSGHTYKQKLKTLLES